MSTSRCLALRPRAPALLLLAAFLSLPSVLLAAQGQGAVSGTVTDELSGVALSAVRVDVRDQDGSVAGSAVTGTSGSYRIEGVPAGEYSVRFTSPGWRTVTVEGQTVVAGQATSVSAAMSEHVFNLNPLTVTASKTEEKTLDAPAAVEVIRRADIEGRPTTTIGDHVRDKPGVDVINTGVQGSYTVIRGFNNIFSGTALTMTDNRIARVPSLRANVAHLNPTTNMDLDKIEVVLGPGSALYGPNAANGVIHTITKSPIDYPGASFAVGGGLRQQKDGAGAGGLAVTGSSKPLFHTEGRIAVAPSDKFGFKVSGQYFSGTEFAFRDQVEVQAQTGAMACVQANLAISSPACAPFTNGLNLTEPADQLIFQQSVRNAAKGRDDRLRRYSFDARADFRPGPSTAVVLSGGRNSALNSVDLTGLGAGQVINWTYSYLQGRVTSGDLFAQVFWNRNDNKETYLVRNGRPLIDKSSLLVGQLQHSTTVGESHRLIYGADYLRTAPDTEGTINGQNEAIDLVTEFGGYAQWEWDLSSKWDFVTAFRVDKNSELEAPVFSPRAALVFKPDLSTSLRATFNRAFSTPTTTNMFLDISGGTVPITGTPWSYDIRATGSRNVGHIYRRQGGIPMHMSPFNGLLGGSDRDFLPTTTEQLWRTATALAVVSNRSLQPLLDAIPAPSASDVGIIPLLLDLEVATGAAPPPGCVAAPFCTLVDLQNLADVAPLKPTINNTFEVGYKGLVSDRVLIGVNGWWSHISDYTSALRLVSPNLFLNGQDVAAYLARHFRNFVGVAFPDAATADSAATALATSLARVPLGTVTPESVGGTTSAMAYVYENLGSVDVLGAEIGADISLSEAINISAAFSWVDKNQFSSSGPGGEMIPLNAPTLKGSAGFAYRNDDAGINGGVRLRLQNGFPANSGVYVGDVKGYGTADLALGVRLPGFEDLWFQLDVQNVLGSSYQTFVGAPELGRMILARMRWDFNPF